MGGLGQETLASQTPTSTRRSWLRHPPHHQWDLQCPRDMWDVAHATTMTPLKGNPTQPQRLNDMWDVAYATTMVASHNTTNTMTNTWNQPVCEKCGYNLDGGGLCGCSNAAW